MNLEVREALERFVTAASCHGTFEGGRFHLTDTSDAASDELYDLANALTWLWEERGYLGATESES